MPSSFLPPVLAKALGGRNPVVLLWADHGFRLYGPCLYVRAGLPAARVKALSAFVRASLRGWELAVRDPQAAAAAPKAP
jgi:ABC-type nitrate/sulfonate/bicarbonate transport system substrate-binding protein